MLPRSSGFADWASDAGLLGADALPDAVLLGDGLPNLMRYALGLPPRQHAGIEHRPHAWSERVSDLMMLNLEHRRRKGSSLTYTYRTSNDITIPVEEWATVSATPTVVNPDTDGDGQIETVSFCIAIPEGELLFLIMDVEE